jgi:hypothetical protein
MGRKSGIGRSKGDDFGKFKKPEDFKDARQSNRFSFRVPKREPDLTRLDDRCGFEDIHTDTDLLHSQGRQSGDTPEYDPVQIQNYKSQAMRYESALGLTIDKTYKNAQGKTVWAFCSKSSPTGFWEVAIAGGTYVKIPNPILLIICPRPFQPSDLGGAVQSDGGVVWTQLQGRITSVSPASGEGALNPFINIYGVPGAYDPPIQLLVSLEDDPLIFDILQITTTPTSDNYGIGFCSLGNGVDPCNTVQTVTPAPRSPDGGYVYDGSPLLVTWNLPTCNQDSLIAMVWQQNVSGEYQAIATYSPASQRLITIQANTYYTIRDDFSVLGLRQYSATSNYFYFNYNPNETNVLKKGQTVFADTTQNGIAIALGGSSYAKYELKVVSLQPTDTYSSGLAIALGGGNYVKYDLKSVSLQPTDTYFSGLAIALGGNSYTKYQLGGVIIG